MIGWVFGCIGFYGRFGLGFVYFVVFGFGDLVWFSVSRLICWGRFAFGWICWLVDFLVVWLVGDVLYISWVF